MSSTRARGGGAAKSSRDASPSAAYAGDKAGNHAAAAAATAPRTAALALAALAATLVAKAAGVGLGGARLSFASSSSASSLTPPRQELVDIAAGAWAKVSVCVCS
jgi:hypothetical protein